MHRSHANVAGEDRTHDLRIMRPTRCRYCHSCIHFSLPYHYYTRFCLSPRNPTACMSGFVSSLTWLVKYDQTQQGWHSRIKYAEHDDKHRNHSGSHKLLPDSSLTSTTNNVEAATSRQRQTHTPPNSRGARTHGHYQQQEHERKQQTQQHPSTGSRTAKATPHIPVGTALRHCRPSPRANISVPPSM